MSVTGIEENGSEVVLDKQGAIFMMKIENWYVKENSKKTCL